jgi:hypothetical protein
VQQVDSRKGRRDTDQGMSMLPQFELQAACEADPDRTLERLPALSADRTLERLPALSADRLPDYSDDVVTAPAVYASTRDLDADMAKTVELVPEVSASDILAETSRPPLVLPAPVVPIDLNRLLARAHAEASRSPEFFHAPSPPPPSSMTPFLLVEEPTPFTLTTTPAAPRRLADELEPEPAPVARVTRVSRRLTWGLGLVGAVAALTFGMSLGRSHASVARAAAAAPAVVAVAAKPVAAAQSWATAEAPAAATVPATTVQSLPRVEAGTISLAAVAASHRLFIDGRVAEGGTKVVTCGRHLVQVGSRGARHYVNVTCGQELVVDR